MADKYPSIAALRREQKEGRDFRIEILDRKAPITVFAFHGGKIETWTSPIARELAGDDWNLYLFEGLMPDHHGDLHVTSHRFEEPRAVALAKRSKLGIAVHGCSGNRERSLCLGGTNRETARAIASALAKSALRLKIENPCEAHPGTHSANPNNLCQQGGVQLELSRALRRDLVENPKTRELELFCRALRSGVR